MKYKTFEFIRKCELVDYIADYYSQLGLALSDEEYDELVSIYGGRANEEYEITKFKDFGIYRLPNGD
ncbi:MAG: hypothetical protein IKB98_06675 [Clostridia bacterium]|nr:hypothetical protein [Clostridia bacterium]